MRLYNTKTGEYLDADEYKISEMGIPDGCVRADEWPALKKAIWGAITESRLNSSGYINAWELAEKIYQRCLECEK